MNAKIKALGYVGCNVSNLDAWEGFLGELFALHGHGEAGGAVRHFRIADHDRTLTLRRAADDALSYIGWEVETQEDLLQFEKRLAAAGIPCERGTEELRRERGVADLLVLSGPDDVRTELFCGPLAPPGSGGSRSAARSRVDNLRLAHVVLASSRRSASVEWYLKTFGFSLSDHIFWDGVEASFMRCNPRHHSLALTNIVGDMRGGDLGHFMLEADSIDDVGRAYDVARTRAIPVAFTFGRHSNDRAFSFYVYSPSGWLVEYGYGGRIIDDAAWEPRLYDAPSIWGHEMQPPPGGDQLKRRY